MQISYHPKDQCPVCFKPYKRPGRKSRYATKCDKCRNSSTASDAAIKTLKVKKSLDDMKHRKMIEDIDKELYDWPA